MSEWTPGPYRQGRISSTIISDHPDPKLVPGADHVKYYGGYLIAESIAPHNVPLLANSPTTLEQRDKGAELLGKAIVIVEKFRFIASPASETVLREFLRQCRALLSEIDKEASHDAPA